ncbi:OsmC family protein [Undibacterium sp. Jales W-56]|uniref:OsmC family protein n=1 Tax=Undibacterium sp. Jales W-56 TaxID=2897325 RepID=UPI0021D30106|nr:OsmC family protein [Undibacterium sp. Jales W-56]MCU6432843.1 OsmC family protein [Undibacterium sp. Jales W-56]
MHHYQASIKWQRGEQVFTDNKYSRAHDWQFDGGLVVPASSSPLSVPLPLSVAENVDPEEALVAAASSCHMLFFLWLAGKKGFIVDEYLDHAVGLMDKNEHGKLAITKITLRPLVIFSGDRQATSEELAALHHQAHEECYIANSLRADIVIEPA